MAVGTVELGLRLLASIALLVAVPLSFVLVFRAIDDVALDDLTEQYRDGAFDRWAESDPEVARNDAVEASTDGDGDAEDAATEGVPCPRCRTRNEPAYTFCRSCGGRLGV